MGALPPPLAVVLVCALDAGDADELRVDVPLPAELVIVGVAMVLDVVDVTLVVVGVNDDVSVATGDVFG